MEIQDAPIYSPMVDKDGLCTPVWQDWFSRLVQQMQINLSSDGFKMPPNTAVDITGPLSTIRQLGDMTYDTTNNVMAVNLNGTMVKLQTLPY